ncbi:inverse autotransporter beta domain-containing protein [Candidatus Omnitrophota bacterium]
MKNKKFYFILIFSMVLYLFCGGFCRCFAEEESSEAIPDWLKRTNFGVEVETDQKPRAYFETVQPLYQDIDNQNTVFIHARYSLQNEESAYNLGLGYRKLLRDNSVLLGANTYFDFEDDDQHYRVGVGFEALINQIELRTNTYIGLSPRRLVEETSTAKVYEKAVDGIDGEIGLPLPHMNWIKVYGGGYWYNYEEFKNKQGWRCRAEIAPFKYSVINLTVYDDNKGDPEVRVDGRVTIPIGPPYEKDRGKTLSIGFSEEAYPEKADHSDKVLKRVERQYNIEVEKWSEDKTTGVTVEIKRGD